MAVTTNPTDDRPRLPAPASAGLGLRRSLLDALHSAPDGAFDFLECAPDNWVGVGGKLGDALSELSARHPLTCHGLSLSLGGPSPLDVDFLQRTRQFLDQHRVALYSEHLSWCSDDGHLYELLPLPFTEETVHYVAARIRQTQDILGRRIAVENASYYALPAADMDEASFINAVLDEADCDLLLDVNNVYVNAINHRYDAREFLEKLPSRRISSYHIAGHHDEADDLKIDTHGMPVKDDVWSLLSAAHVLHGVRPTLLERDFNFPPLAELLDEVAHIRRLQQSANAALVAAHG
ncbi:MAG: HvfB family MNIO-type RiPP peptide maturase [Stenotrophomonas sp.]|uniref:HvfB family MNIO-type RiPP peptide maturase n=1 Tax=Stenotrophomonas sp. TaxID=69392 RepID=UPI003D6CB2EC